MDSASRIKVLSACASFSASLTVRALATRGNTASIVAPSPRATIPLQHWPGYGWIFLEWPEGKLQPRLQPQVRQHSQIGRMTKRVTSRGRLWDQDIELVSCTCNFLRLVWAGTRPPWGQLGHLQPCLHHQSYCLQCLLQRRWPLHVLLQSPQLATVSPPACSDGLPGSGRVGGHQSNVCLTTRQVAEPVCHDGRKAWTHSWHELR